MKTKQYTITYGAYDSYRISAQVEGAATPALPKLYLLFLEFAGLTIEDIRVKFTDKHNNVTKEAYDNFSAAYDKRAKAQKRLKAQGYTGDNLTELFIDWLIKDRNFTLLKSNEFHTGE